MARNLRREFNFVEITLKQTVTLALLERTNRGRVGGRAVPGCAVVVGRPVGGVGCLNYRIWQR